MSEHCLFLCLSFGAARKKKKKKKKLSISNSSIVVVHVRMFCHNLAITLTQLNFVVVNVVYTNIIIFKKKKKKKKITRAVTRKLYLKNLTLFICIGDI